MDEQFIEARKLIAKEYKKINKAKFNINGWVDNMIRACDHPPEQVVHWKEDSGGIYFPTFAEYRQCMQCGLREKREGYWHCFRHVPYPSSVQPNYYDGVPREIREAFTRLTIGGR